MNKVALITGACGGVGTAICEVFSKAGFLVVGIDRIVVKAFAHKYIRCDLSRLAHSEDVAEQLHKDVLALTGNRLDVLINNAAVQVVKPCTEMTRSDWSETIDTNLLAPFWLATLFVQELRETRGSIINIASIHAQLTKRNFVAYATSKGALVTMTKSMALDLAPEIRVNAISPAATDTKMLRDGFIDNPSGYDSLMHYHPLERIAIPEEIGQLALFLAGNNAGFITGSVLTIDGGISGCLSDPA